MKHNDNHGCGCVPLHHPIQPYHPDTNVHDHHHGHIEDCCHCDPDYCDPCFDIPHPDHCHNHHEHCHKPIPPKPCPPMPCPPEPCHIPIPVDLCCCTTDLDYNRLHQLVLKIYRFTKSLKEQLDKVENDVNSFDCESEINDLNTRVSTDEGNITSNTNRIVALENANVTINGKIAALEASDQGQNSRLNGLEQTVDAQGNRINSLAGRVDALETSSGGSDCNCQPQIDSLNTRVSSLEGRVKYLEDNAVIIDDPNNPGSGTNPDNPGGGTGGGSGTGVKSVFKMIYIQSSTKPAKPSGGSVNFNNNSFTVPSGWYADTNSFTDKSITIWYSTNTFCSDGTNFGWSEPVAFTDYEDIFNNLDNEFKDLYDKLLDEASKDLDKVAEDAVRKLAASKAEIDQAKADIVNAKQKLAELEAQGKKLEGQIEFLSELDGDTLTQLKMLAEYLNGEDGTVTNILADINYLKGELRFKSEQIQTIEGRVNTVETGLSAAEATITSHTQSINTINNTVSSVSTKLDGVEAKATTAADWVDANKNEVRSALQEISGIDAKITSQVSDTILDPTGTFATQVNLVKEELNGENAQWRVEVAKKISPAEVDAKIAAANFEVTPEKITAAIANSDGAGAAIVAAINNDTSSVKIDADKILLNGDVIAKSLGTVDLDVNHTSHFYKDGSGYVASGNISWSKDGDISVCGDKITFDKNGNITGLNIFAFPVGTRLLCAYRDNPYNDLWELVGSNTSVINGETTYVYEKKRQGGDNWLANTAITEFTVIVPDKHISAAGGRVYYRDLGYTAKLQDNTDITNETYITTSPEYFNIESKGSEISDSTTREQSFIVRYNNSSVKATVNVIQAANIITNTSYFEPEEFTNSNGNTINLIPGSTIIGIKTPYVARVKERTFSSNSVAYSIDLDYVKENCVFSAELSLSYKSNGVTKTISPNFNQVVEYIDGDNPRPIDRPKDYNIGGVLKPLYGDVQITGWITIPNDIDSGSTYTIEGTAVCVHKGNRLTRTISTITGTVK